MSGNLVQNRCQRKRRASYWRQGISPKPVMLGAPKLLGSPIDGQPCLPCEFLEQRLGRARYFTQPRRRARVVKQTVQIIVVLLIKLPGRSIPILGQRINPIVKKKIDGRLVPKPVAPAPDFQEFEGVLEEVLLSQFIEIYQHYPRVEVNALSRKFHGIRHDWRVVGK